jgi:hypothetical protein
MIGHVHSTYFSVPEEEKARVFAKIEPSLTYLDKDAVGVMTKDLQSQISAEGSEIKKLRERLSKMEQQMTNISSTGSPITVKADDGTLISVKPENMISLNKTTYGDIIPKTSTTEFHLSKFTGEGALNDYVKHVGKTQAIKDLKKATDIKAKQYLLAHKREDRQLMMETDFYQQLFRAWIKYLEKGIEPKHWIVPERSILKSKFV